MSLIHFNPYFLNAIARIAILVFSRKLISLRPVLLGHVSCWELVIARRDACAKIFVSGIIVIMGLHERKTVGDSTKRATAIGLCAIVLWSMMFGFVRLTTQSFGPALGSALIYSCAAVFTYIALEIRFVFGRVIRVLRNGDHHLDRFGGEF